MILVWLDLGSKTASLVCNTHRQGFTTPKSYHSGNRVIFSCKNVVKNKKNLVFILQTNPSGMSACM